MFVSFLMPHVDRGAGPLFHMMMLLQMSRFSPDEICFIGDDAYFAEQHVPFDEELALGTIRFTCVSRERFRAYRKAALPFDAVAALYEGGRSHLDAFQALLTGEHPPLGAAIDAALREMSVEPGTIEAFLSWSNCPTLSAVAAGLDKPVIHNELGPFRGPAYQDTVFFDFQGVNGMSTPATRWTDDGALAAEFEGVQCLAAAELRTLLYQDAAPAIANEGEAAPARYRLGVALQVEDDSNTVAYGRGYDTIRLLHQALRNVAPEQVLVRSHPSARMAYRGGAGEPDDSPSSLAFLGRIKHLLTINSSVAAEAALWGVPYTVLGDTPFSVLSRPLGAESAESPAGASDAMARLKLNALLVGYLVPATLLFDPDYYRWRLRGASLRDCFERHLAVFKREATHARAELPALADAGGDVPSGAASETPHRNPALWTATRSATREAAKLNEQLASLMSEKRELEAKLAAAIAERDKNWDERCWFQTNFERVQQEMNALRGEHDTLRLAMAEQQGQIETLRQWLEAARDTASAAEANLTLSLKAQIALGEQLADTRRRHATAEAQSDVLLDELNRTMLERIEALGRQEAPRSKE